MRGRRFLTEADIERHISNGYGQGAGASYLPWLRVQDVPSHGHSRKVQGVKVDRLHHLFSNLEHGYFLVCEFSEDIVDIREQYPLLPRENTQAIASSLGLIHPRYRGTSVSTVMTTDFVLTTKRIDGSYKSYARTIKYKKDLEGEGARRTLEKLEIEKFFWEAQGIDWTIVTEEEFSMPLVHNLGILRKFSHISRSLMQPDLEEEFLQVLGSLRNFPITTAQALKKISSQLYISYQDSRALYHHLIWNKRISLDLAAAQLQMGMPLPDFDIVLENSASVRVAEGAR